MERKQFTFYRSFWTAIRKLPQEFWLAYMVNIVTYALDEELLLDMNSTQAGMFELVRPNLDAARKKAAAGAEGGRAKKASKQVSKKKNEIENELEIELETETETNCGEGDAPLGRGSVWLGFEKFWDKYPVKIGMEEAWEQWQRYAPDAEALCQNLNLWMRTPQWIKEKGRYIPRAAKFLEQEYYLQTPEGSVPMGASGNFGAAELEAIANIMRED